MTPPLKNEFLISPDDPLLAAPPDSSADKSLRIEQAVKQMINWPTKRINVTRITVDPLTGKAGSPEGATFAKTPKGLEQFREWLPERWGTANYYFYLNEVTPGIELGVTKRADGKTIHKVNESEISAIAPVSGQ